MNEDTTLQEWMFTLEQDQLYIEQVLRELDESHEEFVNQLYTNQGELV